MSDAGRSPSNSEQGKRPLELTGYLSREDADLAHEWMEEHRDADEIVTDTRNNMVVKAVYYEPVKAHYEDQRARALAVLAALENDDE